MTKSNFVLPRVATLIVMALASTARSEPVRLTYEDFLADLIDLSRLPIIQADDSLRQFSSCNRVPKYDPVTGACISSAAGNEAGGFLRIEPGTNEGVMAEMDGPGCIFHIWSGNPQGRIRFYLDGAPRPSFEWGFRELCSGTIDPFVKPLVWIRNPKQLTTEADIYLPIPFGKRCRVTCVMAESAGDTHTSNYSYHIDYRLYPKDWEIETFQLPLSASRHAAILRIADQWSHQPMPSTTTAVQQVVVPAKGQVLAWDFTGPGVIQELRAKLMRWDEKAKSRKVAVRIFWDDEQSPSVDCPLGDFFGGDPSYVRTMSYPMGIGEGSDYCLFAMPFHRNARIVFDNQGGKSALIKLGVRAVAQSVPDNWALFHAKWCRDLHAVAAASTLIEVTGTGKFAGASVYVDSGRFMQWDEGDEQVYVDGLECPSWLGTGSGDSVGGARGPARLGDSPPGGSRARVVNVPSRYQWLLGNNIPFSHSLRVTFRVPLDPLTASPPGDARAVVYWYQLPGGTDSFRQSSRNPFAATGKQDSPHVAISNQVP